MNSEHVEVLRGLRDLARAAIKAGDWVVDGACDPDAVLRRADAAIASLSAPQPPAEAQPCGCGEATCTVPWEPGCGLGKSEQHAVVQAQPVAWSTVKPSRPGVYGVRGFNMCREPEDQFEAIVSVRLHEGDLICNLHEYTSEEDFDLWTRVDDCSDGFEWCEFVPAHPPPSTPVGVDLQDRVNFDLAAEILESVDYWSPKGIPQELTNGLRALTKQPAAVDGAIRRDAERYRWLRLHANTEWEAETVLHVVQAGGRTLDLRIDEALAAQQGGRDDG